MLKHEVHWQPQPRNIYSRSFLIKLYDFYLVNSNSGKTYKNNNEETERKTDDIITSRRFFSV